MDSDTRTAPNPTQVYVGDFVQHEDFDGVMAAVDALIQRGVAMYSDGTMHTESGTMYHIYQNGAPVPTSKLAAVWYVRGKYWGVPTTITPR